MSITQKPLSRLLERQLKKTIGLENINTPQLIDFINRVNDAYIFNQEENEFYRLAEAISAKDYEQVNKSLKEKNDFLDTFNHGLSHDVKNHSSNIIGLVNMLKKYAKKENWDMIKKITRNLDSSVHQLTSIVDGFLFLSRTETDKQQEHKLVEHQKLIKSIQTEIDFLIQSKKVVFNFSIADVIFIEPVLKIILVNLISNSIKYSKEEVTINVKLSCDKDYTYLSVKDNGIGMNLNDNNNKLYNLFNNTNATKGYGVGLFLVKKITDNHNGIINIESELSKGTQIDIAFKK